MTLTTHGHDDHTAGNTMMLEDYPKMKIFGCAQDNIPGLTDEVVDGSEIKLRELTIKAIHVPCHTRGSICYYLTSSREDKKAVFTGDTLFLAGCGKFFEGGPSDMVAAMDKLKRLPDDTAVHSGHEYAYENLMFATRIAEQVNSEAKIKLSAAISLMKTGILESTIKEEKRYNPFMRADKRTVLPHLENRSAIFIMNKLRWLKNMAK
ncbi:Cytoplasmic glyoxalase II [Bonamia ostreae]|uniref:hydroxyacylglutathione hydrolase n=1 Tax=Bonamia ostreae TaxID=126728 RepID=A0ABV2AG93_9EUKA